MDGAVESGERVANEVLYSLFNANKSIQIDYQKTYYYHRELISKIEENKEKQLKVYQNFKSYSNFFLKFTVFFGASYLIIKKFNYKIRLFNS